MLVKIKNARLAFPQLFQAKPFEDGDPAYGASFLMAKDHPSLKDIESAMKAVAKEQWKDKAQGIYDELMKKEKTCLRDGDGKSEYDGYAGNMYLASRRKEKDGKPGIFDRVLDSVTGKVATLLESSGKPYGGCIVNGNVDIWAQDNRFGKRINATLVGVQFVKDGPAFSGVAQPDAGAFEGDTPEESAATGSDGW